MKKISRLCIIFFIMIISISYANAAYNIEISVTDENGAVIECLDGQKTINISGSVNSSISETFYPKLYMAFYNEDCSLAGVTEKTLTFRYTHIPRKQSFSFTADNILSDKKGYIKVYLWDGLTPLAECLRTAQNAKLNIKGLHEVYQTISADYQYDKMISPSIEWFYSSSEDGEYTIFDEGEKIILPREIGGNWIKYKVSDSGLTLNSEALYIEPSYAGEKRGMINEATTEQFSNVMANTPDRYLFTAEGIDFVLLDVTQSDEAKYLIIAKNTIGEKCFFDTVDTEQRVAQIGCYDNLAYYLNNEYKEEYIPEIVQKHIFNNVVWQYESSYYGYGTGHQYYCSYGGIAVPSVSEIKKHCTKMGLQDDGLSWWTRSGYGTYKENNGAVIVMPGKSDMLGFTDYAIAGTEKNYIRPMFYVDKDFFKEVKLSYAGNEVKDIVLSELNNELYTAEEINDIFHTGKGRFNFTITRKSTESEATLGTECIITDGGEYEIRASFGNIEFFNVIRNFEAGFEGKSFDDVALPFGIDDIRIEVYKDDNLICQKYFREVTVTNDFDSNINTSYSLKGYCYPINDINLLQKSGANIVRPNYASRWDYIEKEKGVYDWSEMDNVMEYANEMKYTVIPILGFGNSLYTENENAPADHEAVEGFVNYAKAFAERYPEILYYEMWNEPGSDYSWKPKSNVKDYVSLVQITERALKTINPDIEVAAGSLADANQYFAARLFEEGVYGYSDIIASHPYVYYYNQGSDASFEERLRRINRISLQYGGWKQNFITEIGFPTNIGSVTEEHSQQAVEHLKQLVISDANDIDVNIIYSFRDYGNDENDPECRFGVIDTSNHVKKAYISNQTFFKNTLSALYMGEISLADNVTGYVYRSVEECFMIAWSTGRETEISFDGKVSVIDLYGNVKGDLQEVNITEEPVYIKGLGDEWCVRAVIETLEKKTDDYLEQSNLVEYKSIFEKSINNANSIADGELPALEELINYYNVHTKASEEAYTLYEDGNISQIELSTLLSVIEMSGRQWIKIYAISSPEENNINTDELIASVEKKISQKALSEKTGSAFPLSNSALKLARSYNSKISRLNNSEMQDELTGGIINGWKMMIEFMCSASDMLLEVEESTPDNILIKAFANEAVLEYNKQGKLDVSVYNYDSRDIENATLEIIDAYGNIAGSTVFSVSGGSGVKLTVDTLITDGGAKMSMVDVVVRIGDSVLKSEKIVAMKQMDGYTVYTAEDDAFITDTDEERIFTVGGQEFILLDTSENANSKYFCITKEAYGPNLKAFNSDNKQIFDPDNEKSIAYWLNTEFYEDYLPEEIKRHINKSHYYLTEGASTSGDAPFDNQTKCGVALLSMTELNKYKDILGMVDGNFTSRSNWMWLLRTAENRPDWNWRSMMVNIENKDGEILIGTTGYFANYKVAVRPVFWLDEAFFEDENIITK